ncbi:choice-of-anchor P family protein [Streptomyces sp. URMC 123]|uniref:choice-of-anchor P family protein n=1 Tax=Streptomyces sp. URMC 123 TaxID=3423403 RepID=UPI003F1D3EA0
MFLGALRCGTTAAALLAVGLAGVTPAQAAAGDGSAYGLKAEPVISQAAASSTAGPTSNSVMNLDAPGIVSAGVVESSALHDPITGQVTSNAQASDVRIADGLFGPPGTSAVGIEAARAECTSTQEGTSGTTTLSGLQIPGNPSIPADAVNYSFDVGSGRMTVNEQIHNPDGGMTFNAARLHLPASGGRPELDIVIASATCGPATPPTS